MANKPKRSSRTSRAEHRISAEKNKSPGQLIARATAESDSMLAILLTSDMPIKRVVSMLKKHGWDNSRIIGAIPKAEENFRRKTCELKDFMLPLTDQEGDKPPTKKDG